MQKKAAFERMSKRWVLGYGQFKKAIIDTDRSRIAQMELESKDCSELKEEMWASELDHCLKLLKIRDTTIAEDPKFADWKEAIATRLKRKLL
ncbi:MAG: hypothetical protein CMK36_08055 [Porticoccaceae bacterium]|nr:hypothetical protein [Porticoccaceae bacterium]